MKKEKKEFEERKTLSQWNIKVLIAVPGFMFLGGAISTLQNLSKTFANDIDKIIFIDNWASWIVVLFFSLGWFTSHWIEIALLKKQIKFARVLFLFLLFGSTLISFYFRFFINDEVLHHFAAAPQFLVFSSYCLRYSIFRNESLLLMQNTLLLRKS